MRAIPARICAAGATAGTGHHLYDGSCALCRCGDVPEALEVLVPEVLRLAAQHQAPCALCRGRGSYTSTRGGLTASVACSCNVGQQRAPGPPDSYMRPLETQ